jgi:hypothetical protein
MSHFLSRSRASIDGAVHEVSQAEEYQEEESATGKLTLKNKAPGKKTDQIKEDWSSIAVAHQMLVTVNKDLAEISRELADIAKELKKFKPNDKNSAALKDFATIKKAMDVASEAAAGFVKSFEKGSIPSNLKKAGKIIGNIKDNDYKKWSEVIGVKNAKKLEEIYSKIAQLDKNTQNYFHPNNDYSTESDEIKDKKKKKNIENTEDVMSDEQEVSQKPNNHTDSSEEDELAKLIKNRKKMKKTDSNQDDESVENKISHEKGINTDSVVEDDTNSEGADDQNKQSISESLVASSTNKSAKTSEPAEDDD